MGLGLNPGQGIKIPQAVECSKKKKKGTLEKEDQTKPKESRRKAILKIRAEFNEIENRQTT